MSKLIPMEQAATMLGMSVEQINELRSNQEIFGYKDGGTWKFKMTELERVADNLGISIGGLGGAVEAAGDKAKDSFDDLDFGGSEELLLDDDSSSAMELDIDEDSSVELVESGRSSDIFTDLEEDGVTLEDSGLLMSGTSKELDEDAGLVLGGSGEIDLGESGSFKFEDSDLELSLADDVPKKASGVDLNLVDDTSTEGTGVEPNLADSGSLELEDDDGLGLAESSSDLDVADSGGLDVAAGGAIGAGLAGAALGLAGEQKSDDSELNLEDSGLNLEDSGALNLEDSGAIELEDSGILELGTGIDLDDDEQLSFGASDISLASASGKSLKASDTGSDVLSGVEDADKTDKPPSTGKLASGDDDLLLSEDDLFEDDLVLQDSASFEDSSDFSSDFENDLILDDSDSSSELVLEANQSGIALSNNESGIMLADEPLELGGSDIDQLELPGDDDMIVLDDSADLEAATMMQEDDFNLTPLEQSMDGADGDGSSSQIIALEDSEIFADESEATILGDADAFGEPAMIESGYADADMAGGMAMGAAGDAAMVPGMMSDDAYAKPAAAPEAEYSIGSLLGLVLAASVLLLGSLLAFDTCRNLWMDDGQVVGSGFLDMVVTAFGMKS